MAPGVLGERAGGYFLRELSPDCGERFHKEIETLDALGSMCALALAYSRSYEEDHGKNYSSINAMSKP